MTPPLMPFQRPPAPPEALVVGLAVKDPNFDLKIA